MRKTAAILALAASMGAASASPASDGASVQDTARAIAKATDKLRQAPADGADSLSARMQRLAEQITRQSRTKVDNRLSAESEHDGTAKTDNLPNQTPMRRVYLFVSRSLNKVALEEICQSIAGTSVTAVFRGIPQGAKIGQASAQIYRLIRDADIHPIPNISLNPQRWRDFQVDTVPTLVMAEGDRVIARVSGLTNARWLREQVRSGQTGDLGQRGPIAEPSEPDLITVMQERAGNLDFAKLRDKAQHSYWQDAPMFELAPAAQSQTRTVDLRMRVARDIIAADGTVIARKGQTINPLDQRAFTLCLVVFDPLRAEQVAFAARQAKAHPDALLLATRFDRDAGWDGYRALSERLDSKVYRLTRDIRSRFDVRATPAVVHANDAGAVVIDEHRLEPLATEENHAS